MAEDCGGESTISSSTINSDGEQDLNQQRANEDNDSVRKFAPLQSYAPFLEYLLTVPLDEGHKLRLRKFCIFVRNYESSMDGRRERSIVQAIRNLYNQLSQDPIHDERVLQYYLNRANDGGGESSLITNNIVDPIDVDDQVAPDSTVADPVVNEEQRSTNKPEVVETLDGNDKGDEIDAVADDTGNKEIVFSTNESEVVEIPDDNDEGEELIGAVADATGNKEIIDLHENLPDEIMSISSESRSGTPAINVPADAVQNLKSLADSSLVSIPILDDSRVRLENPKSHLEEALCEPVLEDKQARFNRLVLAAQHIEESEELRKQHNADTNHNLSKCRPLHKRHPDHSRKKSPVRKSLNHQYVPNKHRRSRSDDRQKRRSHSPLLGRRKLERSPPTKLPIEKISPTPDQSRNRKSPTDHRRSGSSDLWKRRSNSPSSRRQFKRSPNRPPTANQRRNRNSLTENRRSRNTDNLEKRTCSPTRRQYEMSHHRSSRKLSSNQSRHSGSPVRWEKRSSSPPRRLFERSSNRSPVQISPTSHFSRSQRPSRSIEDRYNRGTNPRYNSPNGYPSYVGDEQSGRNFRTRDSPPCYNYSSVISSDSPGYDKSITPSRHSSTSSCHSSLNKNRSTMNYSPSGNYDSPNRRSSSSYCRGSNHSQSTDYNIQDGCPDSRRYRSPYTSSRNSSADHPEFNSLEFVPNSPRSYNRSPESRCRIPHPNDEVDVGHRNQSPIVIFDPSTLDSVNSGDSKSNKTSKKHKHRHHHHHHHRKHSHKSDDKNTTNLNPEDHCEEITSDDDDKNYDLNNSSDESLLQKQMKICEELKMVETEGKKSDKLVVASEMPSKKKKSKNKLSDGKFRRKYEKLKKKFIKNEKKAVIRNESFDDGDNLITNNNESFSSKTDPVEIVISDGEVVENNEVKLSDNNYAGIPDADENKEIIFDKILYINEKDEDNKLIPDKNDDAMSDIIDTKDKQQNISRSYNQESKKKRKREHRKKEKSDKDKSGNLDNDVKSCIPDNEIEKEIITDDRNDEIEENEKHSSDDSFSSENSDLISSYSRNVPDSLNHSEHYKNFYMQSHFHEYSSYLQSQHIPVINTYNMYDTGDYNEAEWTGRIILEDRARKCENIIDNSELTPESEPSDNVEYSNLFKKIATMMLKENNPQKSTDSESVPESVPSENPDLVNKILNMLDEKDLENIDMEKVKNVTESFLNSETASSIELAEETATVNFSNSENNRSKELILETIDLVNDEDLNDNHGELIIDESYVSQVDADIESNCDSTNIVEPNDPKQIRWTNDLRVTISNDLVQDAASDSKEIITNDHDLSAIIPNDPIQILSNDSREIFSNDPIQIPSNDSREIFSNDPIQIPSNEPKQNGSDDPKYIPSSDKVDRSLIKSYTIPKASRNLTGLKEGTLLNIMNSPLTKNSIYADTIKNKLRQNISDPSNVVNNNPLNSIKNKLQSPNLPNNNISNFPLNPRDPRSKLSKFNNEKNGSTELPKSTTVSPDQYSTQMPMINNNSSWTMNQNQLPVGYPVQHIPTVVNRVVQPKVFNQSSISYESNIPVLTNGNNSRYFPVIESHKSSATRPSMVEAVKMGTSENWLKKELPHLAKPQPNINPLPRRPKNYKQDWDCLIADDSNNKRKDPRKDAKKDSYENQKSVDQRSHSRSRKRNRRKSFVQNPEKDLLSRQHRRDSAQKSSDDNGEILKNKNNSEIQNYSSPMMVITSHMPFKIPKINRNAPDTPIGGNRRIDRSNEILGISSDEDNIEENVKEENGGTEIKTGDNIIVEDEKNRKKQIDTSKPIFAISDDENDFEAVEEAVETEAKKVRTIDIAQREQLVIRQNLNLENRKTMETEDKSEVDIVGTEEDITIRDMEMERETEVDNVETAEQFRAEMTITDIVSDKMPESKNSLDERDVMEENLKIGDKEKSDTGEIEDRNKSFVPCRIDDYRVEKIENVVQELETDKFPEKLDYNFSVQDLVNKLNNEDEKKIVLDFFIMAHSSLSSDKIIDLLLEQMLEKNPRLVDVVKIIRKPGNLKFLLKGFDNNMKKVSKRNSNESSSSESDSSSSSSSSEDEVEEKKREEDERRKKRKLTDDKTESEKSVNLQSKVSQQHGSDNNPVDVGTSKNKKSKSKKISKPESNSEKVSEREKNQISSNSEPVAVSSNSKPVAVNNEEEKKKTNKPAPKRKQKSRKKSTSAASKKNIVGKSKPKIQNNDPAVNPAKRKKQSNELDRLRKDLLEVSRTNNSFNIMTIGPVRSCRLQKTAKNEISNNNLSKNVPEFETPLSPPVRAGTGSAESVGSYNSCRSLDADKDDLFEGYEQSCPKKKLKISRPDDYIGNLKIVLKRADENNYYNLKDDSKSNDDNESEKSKSNDDDKSKKIKHKKRKAVENSGNRHTKRSKSKNSSILEKMTVKRAEGDDNQLENTTLDVLSSCPLEKEAVESAERDVNQLKNTLDVLNSCTILGKKSVDENTLDVEEIAEEDEEFIISNDLADKLTFKDPLVTSLGVGSLEITVTDRKLYYKCHVRDCIFDTYDAKMMECHTKFNHNSEKWTGFCSICNSYKQWIKVEKKFSLAFLHAVKFHINIPPPSVRICESPDYEVDPELDHDYSKSSTADNDSDNENIVDNTESDEYSNLIATNINSDVAALDESINRKSDESSNLKTADINNYTLSDQIVNETESSDENSNLSTDDINYSNTASPSDQNVNYLEPDQNLNFSMADIIFNTVDSTAIDMSRKNTDTGCTLPKNSFRDIEFENEAVNKPRLKIRRLSGDRLSGSGNIQTAMKQCSNNVERPTSAENYEIKRNAQVSPPAAITSEKVVASSKKESPNGVEKRERSPRSLLTLLPKKQAISTQQVAKNLTLKTMPPGIPLAAEPTMKILKKNSENIQNQSQIKISITKPVDNSENVKNQSQRKNSISKPIGDAVVQPEKDEFDGVLTDIQTPILSKTSNASSMLNSISKSKQRLNTYRPKKILSENYLLHLYKCGAAPKYCSFMTSDKNEFISHIGDHELVHNSSEYVEEKKKFLSCVYCRKFYETADNLQKHIFDIHGHCHYQCAYCVYRAAVSCYVSWHQSMTHVENTIRILTDSDGDNLTNIPGYEISNERFAQIILPYKCYRCSNSSWLTFESFKLHMSERHSNIRNFDCHICRERIVKEEFEKHMTTHEISMYQCLYCLKGTNETIDMLKHLIAEHPTNFPRAIIRRIVINRPNMDNSIYDEDSKQHLHVENYDEKLSEEFIHKIKRADSKFVLSTKTFDSGSTVSITGSAQYDDELQSSLISVPEPEPESDTPANEEETNAAILSLLQSGKRRTGTTVNATESDETTKTTENVTEQQSPDSSVQTEESDEDDEPLLIFRNNPELSEEFNKNLNTPSDEQRIDSDKTIVPDIYNLGYYGIDPGKSECDGLYGRSLYKCGYKGCKFTSEDSSGLKDHLCICEISRLTTKIKCAHCPKYFVKPESFVEHSKYHGIARFICSLCDFRASILSKIFEHMKRVHHVSHYKSIPIDPSRSHVDTDLFIVLPDSVKKPSPLEKQKGQKGSATPIKINQNKDMIYSINHIKRYPIGAVFRVKKTCGICRSYCTRMCKDLRAHMEKHIVDSRRTVDSRRNHRDKEIPHFVPENKRYTCGIANCGYHAVNYKNLVQHCSSTHNISEKFDCLHCSSSAPKSRNIPLTEMAAHFALHDMTLYKCMLCEFYHKDREIILGHISGFHPNGDSSHVQIIREIAGNSLTRKVKWNCNLCDFTDEKREVMEAHCRKDHSVNAQFKCGYCRFCTNEENEFGNHWALRHTRLGRKIVPAYTRVEYWSELSPTSPTQQRSSRTNVPNEDNLISVVNPSLTVPPQQIPRKISNEGNLGTDADDDDDCIIVEQEVPGNNEGHFVDVNQLPNNEQHLHKNEEDGLNLDERQVNQNRPGNVGVEENNDDNGKSPINIEEKVTVGVSADASEEEKRIIKKQRVKYTPVREKVVIKFPRPDDASEATLVEFDVHCQEVESHLVASSPASANSSSGSTPLTSPSLPQIKTPPHLVSSSAAAVNSSSRSTPLTSPFMVQIKSPPVIQMPIPSMVARPSVIQMATSSRTEVTSRPIVMDHMASLEMGQRVVSPSAVQNNIKNRRNDPPLHLQLIPNCYRRFSTSNNNISPDSAIGGSPDMCASSAMTSTSSAASTSTNINNLSPYFTAASSANTSQVVYSSNMQHFHYPTIADQNSQSPSGQNYLEYFNHSRPNNSCSLYDPESVTCSAKSPSQISSSVFENTPIIINPIYDTVSPPLGLQPENLSLSKKPKRVYKRKAVAVQNQPQPKKPVNRLTSRRPKRKEVKSPDDIQNHLGQPMDTIIGQQRVAESYSAGYNNYTRCPTSCSESSPTVSITRINPTANNSTISYYDPNNFIVQPRYEPNVSQIHHHQLMMNALMRKMASPAGVAQPPTVGDNTRQPPVRRSSNPTELDFLRHIVTQQTVSGQPTRRMSHADVMNNNFSTIHSVSSTGWNRPLHTPATSQIDHQSLSPDCTFYSHAPMSSTTAGQRDLSPFQPDSNRFYTPAAETSQPHSSSVSTNRPPLYDVGIPHVTVHQSRGYVNLQPSTMGQYSAAQAAAINNYCFNNRSMPTTMGQPFHSNFNFGMPGPSQSFQYKTRPQ